MHRVAPAIFAILIACDADVVWVDPAITLATTNDLRLGALILGEGRGATFTAYENASPITVVDGLQGGTWTMPTLRVESLASSLWVDCTLFADSSTSPPAGQSAAQVPARPAKGEPGWVEIADFPIAVPTPTPGLHTLECTVTLKDVSASASHDGPLALPAPSSDNP
jgi:hypothetical protein